jgi:hypothetical protein
MSDSIAAAVISKLNTTPSSVSVEELTYVQKYLEHLKTRKINESASQINKKNCTMVGDIRNTKPLENPYSYGAKQNSLGPLYKPEYVGPYAVGEVFGLAPNMYMEQFPGDVRNVNIESTLLQREATHWPGQRELTSREINRFELLPYDPQDTRHIVWDDNMPRGGYPTRSDRLETI